MNEGKIKNTNENQGKVWLKNKSTNESGKEKASIMKTNKRMVKK